jgi:hypothetical protein
MKAQKKHTFYPEGTVEAELKEIPRGRLSERVNELILKGLSYEKQEAVALAYQQYDAELAKSPTRDFETSSSRFLSAGAFKAEDDVEDFV